MSESPETTIESREDFMVSPVGDSKPTLRIAHFIKPSVTSIDGPVCEIPSSFFSSSPSFEPKRSPLTVKFNGWQNPPRKWVEWVDSLEPTYGSVWRNVGIYEAIMSTKYKLLRDEDLLFGIAERWCSKTNTFVFPWAEATITLEDIMILGGYPVLGASVLCPLRTQELKEIEQKLILGRKETWSTKRSNARLSSWISIFMNSGREIEHEAFLSAWLSFFVLPGNSKTLLINESVFPIAIHLTRGNPIALATSVLAAIYKDLTLLKRTIVDLTRSPVDGDKECLELILRSPFYLVQIWVWERIEALQPKPVLINNGDPFLARWHNVMALQIDNVRLVLDTVMEDFIWRPYTRLLACKSKKFYAEKSMCVPNDDNLDEELTSFVICLRVCELVGLACIEKYLPHRVSMQFGMDQDLPGSVNRFNESPEIAWANYCRPIMDTEVYIPSRFFEADVTTRYAEWWKHSALGHQDPVKNIVQKKRSPRCSKKRSYHEADFSIGFAPKCSSNPVGYGKSCGFLPKHLETVVSEDFLEKLRRDNNADVPPGFDAKECKPTLLSNQCHNSFAFTADCVTVESEASMGSLEESMEDACGRNQSSVANDRVNQSPAEGKRSNNSLNTFIMDLENRISGLEKKSNEEKTQRFSYI